MSNTPIESIVPPSPEKIDSRYRIETELGHGGMAFVYRVFDERSGERVAFKKLFAKTEQAATLQAMFEHDCA